MLSERAIDWTIPTWQYDSEMCHLTELPQSVRVIYFGINALMVLEIGSDLI